MKRKRRTFSASQKAKIAIAALQERQSASEIARDYEVHPNQVSQWKKQALDILKLGFETKRKEAQVSADQAELISSLYERIGRLEVERDWLKKNLSSCSTVQKRSLIHLGAGSLSLSRQCELLGLSRSSYYYQAVPESKLNLQLMCLIDEQYLETPFYGVGQMTRFLRRMGYEVNPKRVRRLLRKMGLVAICPGPQTSKPGKGEDHQVFPYLLRDLKICYPGQVIGTDITYIPLEDGFLYLVAFMDWFSRYVLSWELSNSLEKSFCLEALERIWAQVGVEILNTDQGAQFTSTQFVEAVLSRSGVQLSMDGKGRAIDNVFTERLWRSLKYEEVYLKQYIDGREAWQQIHAYFEFYNHRRPHSKLGGKVPAEVFCQRVG